MSRQQANITAPTWNLKNHTAFEVLEGSLSVAMSGQSATLIMGDVAFIPGGTAFSYQATSNFAKFMYVSSGLEGLDKTLMSAGSTWEYPVFPTYQA